jgi:hypothetical protein
MKRARKEPAADLLDTMAARAAESGAKHDEAILQALREYVWNLVARGDDPEKACKIIGLIIASRRQAVAEKNASHDGYERVEEWLNQSVEPELRVAPE